MATRQGIIGKKLGMTQVFDEKGVVSSVTVIEAGPCYVTQVKTVVDDGYNAIQLGFGQAKRLNKPDKGHLGDLPSVRYLRELRTDDVEQYKLGQAVDVSRFSAGDLVDVIGTSKGKGFAGGMKRYHFHGGPMTRGQSDRQRAPGAIGAGTTPGRVIKGHRGPGHMGNRQVTNLALKVIKVDPERNLLIVRGSVPGPTGALVFVRKATKTKVARKRRALQG
jgi:large subunit ribosomal protein L3